MRILICSLGFGYAWYEQAVGDSKEFMHLIQQRFLDCSKQEWYSKVDFQCPEYLYFHPNPLVSPHHDLVQSFTKRRIFSLLRTLSLPLKNNMLRLNLANNNLCEKCNGVFCRKRISSPF